MEVEWLRFQQTNGFGEDLTVDLSFIISDQLHIRRAD